MTKTKFKTKLVLKLTSKHGFAVMNAHIANNFKLHFNMVEGENDHGSKCSKDISNASFTTTKGVPVCQVISLDFE